MPLPPVRPGAKGSPKSAAAKIAASTQDARALEEAARQDRHRTEALQDECDEVEEGLEILKKRYDMYFLGIERRAPARERDEMKRRIERLKGEFTRNSGLRFRIETLRARFLAYERMWLRSTREKEEGTYRRDVLRARRRTEAQVKREGTAPQEAAAQDTPAPAVPAPVAAAAPPAVPAAVAPAAAPVAPAPAAAAAPRPAAKPTAPAPAPAAGAGLPQGVSEAQLRALYGAYVEAKKRCNEDTSRLSYDGLARTVAKQVPELMTKYKARSVEFKVVIKDGRAILKAIPHV